MSAALRLVDVDANLVPTMSPASLPTARPSMHFSTRPTLVPGSRAAATPPRFARVTEPPTTQRSATVHPRFEQAARLDARNLLAVMRMNVEFLESLLRADSSPLAIDALADLHDSIDRLERRFTSLAPAAHRLAG